MKPFILNFIEQPKFLNNYDELVYSDELNLTIIKNTNEVAVSKALLDTSTSTRENRETTDSDQSTNSIKAIFDTSTMTLVSRENSDEDPVRGSFTLMLDTQTLNEGQGGTSTDTD